MTNRNYTTTDAVLHTLQNLSEGVGYAGWQIHEMILQDLRRNGSLSKPYDSTTLRLVRKYGRFYGVYCERHNRFSKYYRNKKAPVMGAAGDVIQKGTNVEVPPAIVHENAPQPQLFETSIEEGRHV